MHRIINPREQKQMMGINDELVMRIIVVYGMLLKEWHEFILKNHYGS